MSLCYAVLAFLFVLQRQKKVEIKSRNVNMWTISSGKTVHIMTTCSTTLHVTYAMNECLNVVGGETIQQRPIIIHFDLHDISN